MQRRGNKVAKQAYVRATLERQLAEQEAARVRRHALSALCALCSLAVLLS